MLPIKQIINIFMILVLVTMYGHSQEWMEKIPDSDVELAVTQSIQENETLANSEMSVFVKDGIVTLSGWVEHLLARDQAVAEAMTIRGVRSVIDRIMIKPSFVEEETIRNNIRRSLAFNPATEAYELDVQVAQSVATLSGTVQSWQEKMLSENVAKGVKGVRRIVNNIKIQYADVRPDHEIAAEIRSRLKNSVWINEENVDVKVFNGTVTLSGFVGTLEEKNRVFADSWVPGVYAVSDDDVQVMPVLDRDMKRDSQYDYHSDVALKNAILDAYAYDPRIMSYHPEVEVKGGIVTLKGFVKDFLAKSAAEENAQNTVGVLEVHNKLVVEPFSNPGDDIIKQRVEEALLWDPVVEKYRISVMVDNGEVFMEGTAANYSEKIHASKVAGSINGVVDVINNIEVIQETRLN